MRHSTVSTPCRVRSSPRPTRRHTREPQIRRVIVTDPIDPAGLCAVAAARVRRIREMIAGGTYETEAKLDLAIDRLLADLQK